MDEANTLQQQLESLHIQKAKLELQFERKKQKSSERLNEMENKKSELKQMVEDLQRDLEEKGDEKNDLVNQIIREYLKNKKKVAMQLETNRQKQKHTDAVRFQLILPDVTAPGVDILAAWSEAVPLIDTEDDTRIVTYNIVSGTSMSCPHATGAATYVKSFHPTWSPAAIKSALMTTAFPMSSENNLEVEFAYGAGHINPAQVAQPGLVYDADEINFVKFLCGQGYTPKQLKLITESNFTCSEETNGTVWDLNYPSFTLSTSPENSITRVFHRTVTNVGSPVSTYKAIVNAPTILIIQVQPSVLSFKSLGQKLTFVVTVGAEIGNSMISGSLIWDDECIK
ncbi:hypothetical protein GOBAR_AA32885 [Gossypium barbadense]|uniref:Subtilisin-like protease fibronectin type-III domain-containing protein n=1 Tax=Gossypium barbadense TaxID=3634 RepID=A0A2P5W9M0_GOSBA|nr:hypothetical protein GOBAR_AA32885 [Gossypium barbadense]